MKKPIHTLLAVSTLLCWQASTAIAADSCTSMQVYLNIGPHTREDVLAEIVPKIKQQMKVDVVAEQMGSAQMLERVAAQGATPRVTLMELDTPVAADACTKQKLCTPIDLGRMPNASNLSDWAISRNDKGEVYALNVDATAIGLVYNEKEFASHNLKPPTSWADLDRPELKGHVTITSPVSTWGLMELAMFARIHGGSESNIEPGFVMAKALQPDLLQVHTWSAEAANLFQLGDAWLGATGANIATSLKAKGVPVKWIAPVEGAPLSSGGFELIEGSPCHDAAYAFMNLYISEQFGLLRMANGGMLAPAKTAWDKATPEVKAAMGMQPSDFGRYLQMDWVTINQHKAEWVARFQREMQ
jgi:putative spermidine/putrescine transport system substrate-binding protein